MGARAPHVANRHRARLGLFLLPRKRSSRFRVPPPSPRRRPPPPPSTLPRALPSRVTPPEPAPVTEHEGSGRGTRYDTRSGESGPAMVLVRLQRERGPLAKEHARARAQGPRVRDRPVGLRVLVQAGSHARRAKRHLQRRKLVACGPPFCEEVVGEPAFVMCNSVGGVAGLQAAVDDARWIRGVVLINVSLRGLHVTETACGDSPVRERRCRRRFARRVSARVFRHRRAGKDGAEPREAYGDPDAVTDELVECILKPGLQLRAARGCSWTSSRTAEGRCRRAFANRPGAARPRRSVGARGPPGGGPEGGVRAVRERGQVHRAPGRRALPHGEAPELVNPLLMEFVEDYRASTPGAP